MIQEIWKDIPGHPGYKVSNHCAIKSFRSKTPRILKHRLVGGVPSVRLLGSRPITMSVIGVVSLVFRDSNIVLPKSEPLSGFHYRIKLSDYKRRQIVGLLNDGIHPQSIANKFGVSVRTIQRIKKLMRNPLPEAV